MANTGTTINLQDFIVATIQELIERRKAEAIAVRPESNLLTDLALESLELAELAAALVDQVGNDPFTDGIFPETVADLVAFYN